MKHADVRERLSDYLNLEQRDLSIQQRALIAAHLDECENCFLEHESLRDTLRWLHALGEVDEPSSIAAAVMERIDAGEARPTFWSRFVGVLDSWTQPGHLVVVAAAACAGAGIAILGPELLPASFIGRTSAPVIAHAPSQLADSRQPRLGVAPATTRQRLLGASRPSQELAEVDATGAPRFAPLPLVQTVSREPRALVDMASRIASIEERERWLQEQARLAVRLGIAHRVVDRLREVPEPVAQDIRVPFERAAFENGAH